MNGITKKSLRSLLNSNKRGKLKVLYLYYKDAYFNGDRLPAHFIAELISQDLSMKIEPHSIYNIQKRYEGNTETSDDVSSDSSTGTHSDKSNSGSGKQPEKKEEKEWTFSEPDPPGSHIREAFAPHIKKKKS
jgi:hypothetical protein